MTSVVIETTAPKYSESKSSKPGLKKKCLVHSFKVWSYKHVVGVEWEEGPQILGCFCHSMVTDLYYLAAISFFCQIHQYFVKIHWCGTNDYSGMLIDFQEEALYEKIFNCCMMLCITKHYLGVYRPRCHLDKRIEMWKSFISTKSWKNCPESYRLQMSCICTWALLFIWQYMYQCLMFKLFSSKY